MRFTTTRHLTVANTAALVALAVVVGAGTAYAAPTVRAALKKKSVTTSKLANGAVTTSKLRNGAVTSAKVKNGSLLAKDFKAGQLPKGAKGATGATGPQGAPGPQGASGEPGPKGERGPSDGYFTSNSSYATIDDDPSPVIGLTLPAGSYLVEATVPLINGANVANTPVNVTCLLESGGDFMSGSSTVATVPSVAGDLGFASVGLTHALTLAEESEVVVTCHRGWEVVTSAFNMRIGAIKVATLH